jgi:hypothetical protein
VSDAELTRQVEFLKDALNLVLKDKCVLADISHMGKVLSGRGVDWSGGPNRKWFLVFLYVSNFEAAVPVVIDELKRLNLLDYAEITTSRTGRHVVIYRGGSLDAVVPIPSLNLRCSGNEDFLA